MTQPDSGLIFLFVYQREEEYEYEYQNESRNAGGIGMYKSIKQETKLRNTKVYISQTSSEIKIKLTLIPVYI